MPFDITNKQVRGALVETRVGQPHRTLAVLGLAAVTLLRRALNTSPVPDPQSPDPERQPA